MNPELIRIATENKAIVDALKAQIVAKNAAVTNTSTNTKSSSIVWKIMLFAGVVVVAYNLYNYFNKIDEQKNYINY